MSFLDGAVAFASEASTAGGLLGDLPVQVDETERFGEGLEEVARVLIASLA